ncbi:MAG: BTAD domain-containing putative transcriptional regulator [Sphingomicrobium sp.]
MLAQLGQLQAAKPGGLDLVGANVGKQASLVFEVSGLMEGRRARANLVLFAGRKGALLWSKAFERPFEQVGDLRQELGYTAAKVLECTVEAYPDGRPALTSDALKLYLNGCAELAHGSRDTAALVPLFRRVIAAAPQFEGAWAKLLFAEDYTYMSGLDYSADSPLARDLKRDIAAARKINPKMAQAYLAEADLLPFNAFGQKLALVDRAIFSDPNDAPALASRAGTLFAVGRVSDALDDARRAAELDPVSPRARQQYIFALAQAGRTRAALDEIAKAERIWPGSSVITGARFAIHLRFGDPRVAWQMIQAGQTEADWIGGENFLKARLSRKTEDIERALKYARALYQGEKWTFQNLVQTLSILDREDELLALLMSVPIDDATSVTDVTFRPAARELWHNPKSLAYAKRVGLLQYWHSSGEWPSFCGDADLPYDCKKEAAKLLA